MNEVLETVVSKNGIPIRLTYKQWGHIAESHDYMAGNLDFIIETIEAPDCIVHGWTYELVALRHYEKTSISEKHVVVVYKEGAGEGFVITAFMTSKPEALLKRGVVWQRQP